MPSIAEILNSPEGRAALAKSMTEPIKKSLEYHALGAKILMVDELPNDSANLHAACEVLQHIADNVQTSGTQEMNLDPECLYHIE